MEYRTQRHLLEEIEALDSLARLACLEEARNHAQGKRHVSTCLYCHKPSPSLGTSCHSHQLFLMDLGSAGVPLAWAGSAGHVSADRPAGHWLTQEGIITWLVFAWALAGPGVTCFPVLLKASLDTQGSGGPCSKLAVVPSVAPCVLLGPKRLGQGNSLYLWTEVMPSHVTKGVDSGRGLIAATNKTHLSREFEGSGWDRVSRERAPGTGGLTGK